MDKGDVNIVTQSQVFQSRQPCVVSKVPGTFICEIEGLPQIVEWCRDRSLSGRSKEQAWLLKSICLHLKDRLESSMPSEQESEGQLA